MSYNNSDIKKWLDARKQWGRDPKRKGFRDMSLSKGDDTLESYIKELESYINESDPKKLLTNSSSRPGADNMTVEEICEAIRRVEPVRPKYDWYSVYQQMPAPVYDQVDPAVYAYKNIPRKAPESKFIWVGQLTQSVTGWNTFVQIVKVCVRAWADDVVDDTMRRAAVLDLREVPEVVKKKA